eukprot:CAMPEP_0181380686 /NCGR_PEP_ID=MMETSP1106-20121128/19687_1 /TAXON_ID=81844 /ORGANISM="Mantoniella antarctica, Strain SL-175" /LENGTH=762 /DNA_ID=CAMNT_0023499753 /DNA_START=288 /DNA_END=2574 /DNA_ORIENTATION=+
MTATACSSTRWPLARAAAPLFRRRVSLAGAFNEGLSLANGRQLSVVPPVSSGGGVGERRNAATGDVSKAGGEQATVTAASSASSSDVWAETAAPDQSYTEGSTLSANAAASGAVVTMQANFLRVVVKGDAMSLPQKRERLAQFAKAVDRAREAGQTEDAEKLQRRAEEDGPYELLCVVRALLKKIRQRVLVGDGVEVNGVDWVDSRAMVDSVHARRSRLVDPPVANVDHALLVFALERPPLEAKQLTRFLVSMEATGVPFTLVLNKCDLVTEEVRADWEARLGQWGYRPRFVSVATGEGIDELEAELARGMSDDRLEEEDDDEETDEYADEEGFDARDEEGREEGALTRGSTTAEPSEDEEGAGHTQGNPRVTVTQSEEEKARDAARAGGVTVLAGPSGVGKSSLINRLRAGSRLAEALLEAGEMEAAAEAEAEEDSENVEDVEDGEEDGAADNNDDDDDGAHSRAIYITDVDISGGGGGARGAISLKGLELQSVKAVSAKLGRGRHTTRHVTLLPLKSGALLADTPGFGYPSLTTLTVAKLGDCFPEIRRAKRAQGACKFADCTHRDEPGCAVDEMMPWEEERYDMYCDTFDEVTAMERAERQAGYKRESRVRYKSGKNGVAAAAATAAAITAPVDGSVAGKGGAVRMRRGEGKGGGEGDDGMRVTRVPKAGVQRMEAKLDTKSHRRQSRRSRNMETEREDMEGIYDQDEEEHDDMEMMLESADEGDDTDATDTTDVTDVTDTTGTQSDEASGDAKNESEW